MAASRYYQVEGYGADIVCSDGPMRYNTKLLAQKIAQTVQTHDGNLIEMILGITLKGSSHLLLTEAQVGALRQPLRLLQGSTGRRASDFESLSPVILGVEDLAKKISTLQPKGKKSQGDTSQANRSYIGPSSDLNNYPSRGAFEHSRLLYRILDNTVEPEKYGARNISWRDGLRIRAFSLNVYPHDTRPRSERTAHPKVLDVGVCDAKTSMAPIPDYTTARHIRHLQNKTLMARKVKKDYIRNNQNVTEEPADIGVSIRGIFADCQEKSTSPLVLLVHDEERTRSFLKNMQVNTADWRSGVKGLVSSGDINRDRDRGHTINGHEQRGYERRGYEQHRGHGQRDNGRAASPPRNFGRKDSRRERYGGESGYRSSDRDRNQEAPQKQPQRPYAPVYIVDVLKMYKTFMQTDATMDPVNDNVVLLAKFLDIGGVDETNWWCAGEEACLLIEIWCAMASGADLDTERALNMKTRQDDEEEEEEEEEEEQQNTLPNSAGPSCASVPGSSSGPADNDSDDEEDPNFTSSVAVVQSNGDDYYDQSDDEASDSD